MNAWGSGLKRLLLRRLRLDPVVKALRETAPPPSRHWLRAPPYSLGRLTLVVTALLLASGVVLAFFYEPTAVGAAASIQRLQSGPLLGRVARSTHRWSALVGTALVMLHGLRAWLVKAFRDPREISWWIGLSLLAILLLLGGTGYLLRWDIKAFSLMDLLVSNLRQIPVIGSLLVTLMLGGTGEDLIPLFRGYAFHIWLLPTLLVMALATHLAVIARQGLSRVDEEGWWNDIPWSRWFPGIGLLLGVLLLAFIVPLDQPASGPEVVTPWPHPDWLMLLFFLPFWLFEGGGQIIGAVALPLAGLILLIAIPWIDGGARWGWLSLGFAALGILAVGFLWGQTARMGTQVPLQGCGACHTPAILGGAPETLSGIDIRDPNWLVFHLREPVRSILTPIETD